jgi:hypothetical protein
MQFHARYIQIKRALFWAIYLLRKKQMKNSNNKNYKFNLFYRKGYYIVILLESLRSY